ncbi:MAG: hypothetical protein J0M02_09405 [Planctomycetes bacterium]|nr:hypothetical protein [Planctomycetota bacterium]
MARIDDLLPDPPPELGPGSRPGAFSERAVMAAVTPFVSGLAPGRADALTACALLWHDHLDAAHRLVQRHEGDRDADCIHAIMHRREPDEGNSRYWWRRVGTHPVADELAQLANGLGLGGSLAPGGVFSPAAMATACVRGGSGSTELRTLQAHELRLLARHLLAP